jgi:2'-hydroxyisoflavone reductase
VHRIDRGGDVLAPEPRDQPVQLIHGRDLADWLLDMAEKGETGVYNATGPETPLTMERLLEAIVAETGNGARLVWVDEDYLVENGVEAWSDLPLWLAPGGNPEVANFLAVDVTRAVTAGLRFRPLARTIRDTLEHADTSPAAGLDEARERELLAR